MRPTIKSLRQRTGKREVQFRNMARRLAVKLSGTFWQLSGYTDGSRDEVFDPVEMFQGVGFRSRPLVGSDAEVIVIQVGSKSHPVGVASRDKGIEISIEAGETAIFNSTGARVIIKANGEIHITDSSGTTDALVTKTEFNAHVHATGTGPSATPTTPAVGTTVLKAK